MKEREVKEWVKEGMKEIVKEYEGKIGRTEEGKEAYSTEWTY